MIEPTNGTTVLSPVICPGSTSHYSTGGAGGYHELPSLTRRNTLPVDAANRLHYDGMGSGHRRQGMLVVITADADPVNWPTYRLEVPNYEQLSPEQKVAGLADNANWKIQVAQQSGPQTPAGPSGTTELTSAQARALGKAGQLVKGQNYLVTDYKNLDITYGPDGARIVVNGGVTDFTPQTWLGDFAACANGNYSEPLLFVADSTSTFSQNCSSPMTGDTLRVRFNMDGSGDFNQPNPVYLNSSTTPVASPGGKFRVPLTEPQATDFIGGSAYVSGYQSNEPYDYYETYGIVTAQTDEYLETDIDAVDVSAFDMSYHSFSSLPDLSQPVGTVHGELLYRANANQNISAWFDWRNKQTYTQYIGVLANVATASAVGGVLTLDYPSGQFNGLYFLLEESVENVETVVIDGEPFPLYGDKFINGNSYYSCIVVEEKAYLFPTVASVAYSLNPLAGSDGFSIGRYGGFSPYEVSIGTKFDVLPGQGQYLPTFTTLYNVKNVVIGQGSTAIFSHNSEITGVTIGDNCDLNYFSPNGKVQKVEIGNGCRSNVFKGNFNNLILQEGCSYNLFDNDNSRVEILGQATNSIFLGAKGLVAYGSISGSLLKAESMTTYGGIYNCILDAKEWVFRGGVSNVLAESSRLKTGVVVPGEISNVGPSLASAFTKGLTFLPGATQGILIGAMNEVLELKGISAVNIDLATLVLTLNGVAIDPEVVSYIVEYGDKLVIRAGDYLVLNFQHTDTSKASALAFG